MELSWLEDFLTLAQFGNFSRAAEARHVTQPAFGRRIRALEEWVGTALFDRATHQVTLTTAGQHFHPIAAETLRSLYQGRDTAREAGGTEATTLRFAATHVLSFTFFPAWLRALEGCASLGTIRLISDSMEACEQVLLQGQAQFLLCHHHPLAPNRLDPGRFRSTTVGHDTLELAAAPAMAQTAAADGDLAALPHLAYSAASGLGRILAVAAASERLPEPPPVFTSHLAAVLCRMACDGRGIAWLPRSLIAGELQRDALRLLGSLATPIELQIELFRPRARQSHTAEAFWDLVARPSQDDRASG